ncbi:MAG: DNA methyltransferase [Candidatus Gracilibacteria bacterium]|jgi:tRNA G10  N-methylase Trm11
MKTPSKTYLFQTGHGKGLAKAEIEAVAKNLGEGKIIAEVEDGFVVEGNIPDARAQLNRMGSIVRIGEVLQSGPAHMPLNFEEWVKNALEEKFKGYKGKMRYGLSMHPKNEATLKKILIGAKKAVKALGNVRFVNKDFQNLSSVQAWHEHLLEQGAVELHLFKSMENEDEKGRWYLVKTLAIQDFEWYSKRDYDRPAKDAKNGMFPPKLAQILINLAEPEPGSTIMDPFCGSGTVLQEALLMDYAAWGSDLEKDMVEGTKTNLAWLSQKSKKGEQFEYTVIQADAGALSPKDLPSGSFTIVSETWLGPRLTKLPSPQELAKIQTDVEELFENFLGHLKTVVKRPVTLVLTAPFHKEKNDRHFLPHLPEILASHGTIIPLQARERPSLFYERKDQTVAREIWKLKIG